MFRGVRKSKSCFSMVDGSILHSLCMIRILVVIIYCTLVLKEKNLTGQVRIVDQAESFPDLGISLSTIINTVTYLQILTRIVSI